MGDDTDFTSLYRELGVDPACPLVDFRQAYRRRVAQLHPDQNADGAGVERLQELNRMYDAANAFHAAHGRLPGAVGHAPGQARVQARAGSPPGRPDGQGDRAPTGTGALSRYFVALAVLAIGALALSAMEHRTGKPKPFGSPATVAAHGLSQGRQHAPTISLGMSMDEVRKIEGAPLGDHAVRWDYGPSWIDSRCGGVVTDWYSSPLRPLHAASAHPTTQDWDRFDAKRPDGC